MCLVLGEPGTGKSVLKQSLLTHDRDLAGDAIDRFTQVFGMSFHDAMRAITGT